MAGQGCGCTRTKGPKPEPETAGAVCTLHKGKGQQTPARKTGVEELAVKKAESGSLQIDALKQGRVTLRMIGTTPLYYNAMSLKVKHTLQAGGAKKTAAERRELKHHPEAEFRDSVYRQTTGYTLLCFPAPGVKAAMATAALETAGVTKTSVNRLIFLPQQRINIWGRPLLKCDVVRSADMNKTPDVRTRAYLPRWCAEVQIAFITPTLSTRSIVSLLSNAGVIVGIGDFRQEKGKGSFGTFRVIGDGDTDPEWDEITQEARAVQEFAMFNPECADDETKDLIDMYQAEVTKRAA